MKPNENEIVRMAKEAGFLRHPLGVVVCNPHEMFKFADMVFAAGAEAERNRILDVCKNGLEIDK
ncbi:MAG: hypothetical protein RLZZ452_1365 [Pseudomonadota bacterium]|jgi:hypothetical protein